MKRSSHALTISFITLCLCVAGCSRKSTDANTTAATTPTTTNAPPNPKSKKPTPDFTVNATDLFKEISAYKGLEASEKYGLKQIVISGQINTIAIGKTPMLVFLAAGRMTEYIAGEFGEEEKNSVVALKEGQKITMQCMGPKFWGSRPILKDCSILSVE